MLPLVRPPVLTFPFIVILIPSAPLDIWSCNSTGEYAGYISGDDSDTSNGTYNGELAQVGDSNDIGSVITDTKTFLRGQQLTNDEGVVQFTTLVPGWYAGRAPHIHIRKSLLIFLYLKVLLTHFS